MECQHKLLQTLEGEVVCCKCGVVLEDEYAYGRDRYLTTKEIKGNWEKVTYNYGSLTYSFEYARNCLGTMYSYYNSDGRMYYLERIGAIISIYLWGYRRPLKYVLESSLAGAIVDTVIYKLRQIKKTGIKITPSILYRVVYDTLVRFQGKDIVDRRIEMIQDKVIRLRLQKAGGKFKKYRKEFRTLFKWLE